MERPTLIDSAYKNTDIAEPKDFTGDEREQAYPNSVGVSLPSPVVDTKRNCTEATTEGRGTSLDAGSCFAVLEETLDKIRTPNFVCIEREHQSPDKMNSLERVTDALCQDVDNAGSLAIEENQCIDSEDSSDLDSSCSVEEISLESIFEKASEEWDDYDIHEKYDMIPKTANEIIDLPVKKPDVELSPLTPIKCVGKILHIMPDCVVIQSNKGCRALDLDSLLCLQDLTVIGYITETFGPIEHPFYLVQLGQKKNAAPLEGEFHASAGLSNNTFAIHTKTSESASCELELNGAQDSEAVEETRIDEQDAENANCKTMDVLEGDSVPQRNIDVTIGNDARGDTAGLDASVEKSDVVASADQECANASVSIFDANQTSVIQSTIGDPRMTWGSKGSGDQKDPQCKESDFDSAPAASNLPFLSDATEQLRPPPTVGAIFERSPSERFNDSEISQFLKKLRCEMSVFCSVEHSKTVVPESVYTAGCDASNAYDEEVPECDQEFSDDEEERKAKQSNSAGTKKRAQKATSMVELDDAKKKCTDTNELLLTTR